MAIISTYFSGVDEVRRTSYGGLIPEEAQTLRAVLQLTIGQAVDGEANRKTLHSHVALGSPVFLHQSHNHGAMSLLILLIGIHQGDYVLGIVPEGVQEVAASTGRHSRCPLPLVHGHLPLAFAAVLLVFRERIRRQIANLKGISF